jgi:hypothetical protein
MSNAFLVRSIATFSSFDGSHFDTQAYVRIRGKQSPDLTDSNLPHDNLLRFSTC